MKEVHIMRGCSGSGKSTAAREIVENHGKEAYIFSTDDYWDLHTDGKIDLNLLGRAHNWNFMRFFRAIRRGTPCVIVDNTNTRVSEFENYARMAIEYGYHVNYHNVNPESAESALECARRNGHETPLWKVLQQWQRFEPLGDLEKINAGE